VRWGFVGVGGGAAWGRDSGDPWRGRGRLRGPLLQHGKGGGVAVEAAAFPFAPGGRGGDGAVEPAAPPFSSRGGGGSGSGG
jgi:hypothetical protein